jgi:hypothetical protein
MSADYQIPEENKDVWKQFGAETEAGRALRRLYSSSAPTIKYPKVKTALRPAPEPLPRRPGGTSGPAGANVRVPHFGPKRPEPRAAVLDVMRRKSEAAIREDTNEYDEYVHPPRAGVDRGAMREGLADNFEYAKGRALPKAGMPVYVERDFSAPKPRAAPARTVADDDADLAAELVEEVQALQNREEALADEITTQVLPRDVRKAQDLVQKQQHELRTLRNTKASKLKDLELVVSYNQEE